MALGIIIIIILLGAPLESLGNQVIQGYLARDALRKFVPEYVPGESIIHFLGKAAEVILDIVFESKSAGVSVIFMEVKNQYTLSRYQIEI